MHDNVLFLNDRYVYLCLLVGSILAIDTCFKQKVTDIIMYVCTYAIIYVIECNRYEYACNGPYCRLSYRCICIHTILKCLHVHLYVTNYIIMFLSIFSAKLGIWYRLKKTMFVDYSFK